MDDRTILYRFFNKSGKLLYVGITKNMPTRMGSHQKTKPWNQVRTITLEHFPDRRMALAAEVDAIANERPKWNLSRGEHYKYSGVKDSENLTDAQRKLAWRIKNGGGLSYVVSQSDPTKRRAWVNKKPGKAENLLTVNALIRKGSIFRTHTREVQNAIVSTWMIRSNVLTRNKANGPETRQ